jgi:iron(III) transport system permease protein
MKKFISFFLYVFLFLFIAPSLSFFFKLDNFSFSDLANTIFEIKKPLFNTIIFGFFVTFFSVSIGILIFWLVNFHNFPFSKFFRYALFLPILIPIYIVGYADAYFFEYNEWLNVILPHINFRNYYGATFVISLALYPYVYILMQSLTNKLQNMIVVSKLSGAGSMKTLFLLVFSSSRPIIIFSTSIILMEVIGEYGLSNHYGLNNVSNFLYREWFQAKNYQYSSISGVIIFLFIALILIFEEKNRGEKNYSNNLQQRVMPKFFLSNTKKFFAFLFCFLIFLFSFLIPIGQLIIFAIEKINQVEIFELLKLIYNTLCIATFISILAIIFGYLINFLFITNKNCTKINNLLKMFIIFAYGIPGSFVAIAIIIWIQLIANYGGDFGIKIKLLIFGSIAGIIYGCLFRFINIAIYTINSGISSQKRELIWCNKIFSRNKIKLFFWSLPIFFKEILIVYLIVLIDSIKELPITLLLRPFNFSNLTTRTYDLISDERYEEAAIPSLLIIILLTVISTIFIKLMNKKFF